MPNFQSPLRSLFCVKGVNQAAVEAGPGWTLDLFGCSMRERLHWFDLLSF